MQNSRCKCLRCQRQTHEASPSQWGLLDDQFNLQNNRIFYFNKSPASTKKSDNLTSCWLLNYKAHHLVLIVWRPPSAQHSYHRLAMMVEQGTKGKSRSDKWACHEHANIVCRVFNRLENFSLNENRCCDTWLEEFEMFWVCIDINLLRITANSHRNIMNVVFSHSNTTEMRLTWKFSRSPINQFIIFHADDLDDRIRSNVNPRASRKYKTLQTLRLLPLHLKQANVCTSKRPCGMTARSKEGWEDERKEKR